MNKNDLYVRIFVLSILSFDSLTATNKKFDRPKVMYFIDYELLKNGLIYLCLLMYFIQSYKIFIPKTTEIMQPEHIVGTCTLPVQDDF